MPVFIRLSSLPMIGKNFFITLLALFISCNTFAQKPSVGCIDKSIRLQADEIKHHYTDQGFKVYRDAMVNMESQEPFPVMVSLEAGHMYQVVFVGHPAVYRIKMEVYDGSDNKIDQQFVMRSKGQSNYLLYNFVPERTDMYLFTFMQKLKNESMCGSLCIMKLESDGKKVVIRPFTEKQP